MIEWGEGLYGDYPEAPVLRLEHVPGQPEVRRITRLR